MGKTEQEEQWSDEMGRKYTDRNTFSLEEIANLYIKQFGISRIKMNEGFLKDIPKNSRFLEAGCNAGNQLLVLQDMGYKDLWGIEIQEYALNIAQKRTNLNTLIQSSIFDIPYKDEFFDIVFTSGVLIHINPKDINRALDEIYRCSNSYIWGFEYFEEEEYKALTYRGEENLLWKTNFCKLFLNRFPNLKLIKQQIFHYQDGNKKDIMYLLKKV